MITKETHSIDWNKTAHIAGVVLVALAQAAWWLTKRIGKVAAAILTVLAKVVVAIVSVWASIPDDQDDERGRAHRAHDENALDLSTGLPVKRVL